MLDFALCVYAFLPASLCPAPHPSPVLACPSPSPPPPFQPQLAICLLQASCFSSLHPSAQSFGSPCHPCAPSCPVRPLWRRLTAGPSLGGHPYERLPSPRPPLSPPAHRSRRPLPNSSHTQLAPTAPCRPKPLSPQLPTPSYMRTHRETIFLVPSDDEPASALFV